MAGPVSWLTKRVVASVGAILLAVTTAWAIYSFGPDSAEQRKLKAYLADCEARDGAGCNNAGRMIGDREGIIVLPWTRSPHVRSAELYEQACELVESGVGTTRDG